MRTDSHMKPLTIHSNNGEGSITFSSREFQNRVVQFYTPELKKASSRYQINLGEFCSKGDQKQTEDSEFESLFWDVFNYISTEYDLGTFLGIAKTHQPDMPISKISIIKVKDVELNQEAHRDLDSDSKMDMDDDLNADDSTDERVIYDREQDHEGVKTFSDLRNLIDKLKETGKLQEGVHIAVDCAEVNLPFTLGNLLPPFSPYIPSLDPSSRVQLKDTVDQVRAFIEDLPLLSAEGDMEKFDLPRRLLFPESLTEKQTWDLLTLLCEEKPYITHVKINHEKKYFLLITEQSTQCCLFLGDPSEKDEALKVSGIYCAPAQGIGFDFDEGFVNPSGNSMKNYQASNGLSRAWIEQMKKWKENGFSGSLFESDYEWDRKKDILSYFSALIIYNILRNKSENSLSPSARSLVSLPPEIMDLILKHIVKGNSATSKKSEGALKIKSIEAIWDDCPKAMKELILQAFLPDLPVPKDPNNQTDLIASAPYQPWSYQRWLERERAKAIEDAKMQLDQTIETSDQDLQSTSISKLFNNPSC